MTPLDVAEAALIEMSRMQRAVLGGSK